MSTSPEHDECPVDALFSAFYARLKAMAGAARRAATISLWDPALFLLSLGETLTGTATQ